ncbi:MAG: radical SAM/SPASM domain-containing protein [Candidatus Helarchaeota archaeon]
MSNPSDQRSKKVENLIKLFLDGPPSLYKFIGPKSIQFEITNRCNVKCVMCDRWKWEPAQIGREELSTQEIFTLINELKELEVQHVLISGGEPFIRRDIADVIKYINERGMALTIITNGVLLKGKKAEALLGGKNSVTFSVDGSSEESYSQIRGINGVFDTIIKNIKNLVALRPRNPKLTIAMHFVVQRGNARKIREYHELASELKVNLVTYGLVHGPHVAERQIGLDDLHLKMVKKQFKQIELDRKIKFLLEPSIRKELSDLLTGKLTLDDIKHGLLAYPLFEREPLPCFSLAYWALIDAFGDVYPCCYAYYDNLSYADYNEKRRQFFLGNVRDQPFREIWDGKRFNELRKIMNPVDVKQFPQVCGNCGSYHFFKDINEDYNLVQGVLRDDSKSTKEKTGAIMQMFLSMAKKQIDRATTSFEEEITEAVKKMT